MNQKSGDTEPTPVLPGPPKTIYPMPPLKTRGDIGWVSDREQRATMADYAGKVLVLDFYATWCIPCRASIPRLIALQEKYERDGLQIVGLNVGGPDDRIKVADFARELKIQYPLGFPDKSLTDLFLSDDQTIPQTFLFDRQGQLAKRFIGYDETTGTELTNAIDAEIKKQ
ncbi:MAG: TlpA family protein disulfide reductase [Pyrinomonadaceae bacterium]